MDFKMIAAEIADAVLEEKIIDRSKLLGKIEMLLKITIKKASFGPQLRHVMEKNDRLIKSIDKEKQEAKYWREALRKIIPNDIMQFHYEEINKLNL